MAFNKSQQKAIKHKKGTSLILAGPGSGKTTVITEHTKFLLDQGIVDENNILVVTFTKNAAMEMQERFNNITDNKYKNVTFGTFHSVYFKIAKDVFPYNESNLIDDRDRNSLLKDIVKKLGMEVKDEKDFFSKLSNEISSIKSDLIDIDTHDSTTCLNSEFKTIYAKYVEYLETNTLIDYDDMLLLCYKAISENEDVLKKWQAIYKYILVDEFQDTNKIQFEILKLLALPENNLFIVGDDDQSIYKFRGARPEIMLNFLDYYPKAKMVTLDVNYRSTPQIILGASVVIANNTERYGKEIKAKKQSGEDIHVIKKTNQHLEALDIIDTIKSNYALGVPYNEMAIIYRSNIQTRLMLEALLKADIPFVVRDGVSNIYEHWVTKDIFAYIQLGMGKSETIHLPKIINKPKRYVETKCFRSIAETTIENVIDYYENVSEKDWLVSHLCTLKGQIEHLQTLTKPYDMICYICDVIGYNDYLKETCQKSKDNIDELMDILAELKNNAMNYETCEEWFSYIVDYTNELKNISKNRAIQKDAVNLLTMHASKGLEYDTVFILDANEGITPNIKARTPEDIEEERRMFYVAMTRAKNRLFIYYVKERNGTDIEKSRFVKELTKGIVRKKAELEKAKIIEEMHAAQETIDAKTKNDTIDITLDAEEIVPQKLETKPTMENIDTSKEIYHKAFLNGYIQEETETKYKIFFPSRNKIIVLDKNFCKANELIIAL